MNSALTNLPAIEDQHALNRERWRELESDSFLASLDHRVETDQFGQILMMPPPGLQHCRRQSAIVRFLNQFMAEERGEALSECPISTSGGVKGADAVWISSERMQKAEADNLLLIAPEICIEVSSPSNTRQELEEKKRLYFEGGAEEVWICGPEGQIAFFLSDSPDEERTKSPLCPDFPAQV